MRTIAIVAGGDSSEYEISVKSAGEVCKAPVPKISGIYRNDQRNKLVLGRQQRPLS